MVLRPSSTRDGARTHQVGVYDTGALPEKRPSSAPLRGPPCRAETRASGPMERDRHLQHIASNAGALPESVRVHETSHGRGCDRDGNR